MSRIDFLTVATNFRFLFEFYWHSLLNLETWKKLGGKNVGTENVTIDCSSSTFVAQTDTLFKTLKGENTVYGHHPKSAAHTHLGQISQG